jgi:hypothetical protein
VSYPLRSVLDEPRPAAPPALAWWDWALVAVVTLSAVLKDSYGGDCCTDR